jgi:hypothetical protein
MDSSVGKIVLAVIIVLLVLSSTYYSDLHETQDEVNKLWLEQYLIERAAEDVETSIKDEHVIIDDSYYKHLCNLINRAVASANNHSRKEFADVKAAIATDLQQLGDFGKRIQSLKTALNEQRAYARWAPALDRITKNISARSALLPMPEHLATNKFLIWDFTQYAPSGIWHNAMLKLPVEHRARFLDDNPVFLVIEHERLETIGTYVRTDGMEHHNSPEPLATIRHAQVSMFGDGGNKYLGTKTISSGQPPSTLSTPANAPSIGNLNFISDDTIVDIILGYLPNTGGKVN